ncbi:hypothetical protein JSE7799_00698 [Jannaschia seosinensis]|uniref:Uncharacterized protein n=1 Tax=Jannaschia seosinensis TaxID=313367 RepID=A0A0M7B9J2_9RHOB|nr:hypothetical protein [Jannaschia seosinensis]CUH25517.1 hypothetical protein JSE7799_00698 [Jannaschia seosinensis]
MSAPQTDLEKQEKRHYGPLIGIAAGVLLALVLLVSMIFYVATPEEVSEPDRVPSPDINQVLPEGVETDEIDPQAPITVAPESEGPATTRGGGRDGDIIDALPDE